MPYWNNQDLCDPLGYWIFTQCRWHLHLYHHALLHLGVNKRQVFPLSVFLSCAPPSFCKVACRMVLMRQSDHVTSSYHSTFCSNRMSSRHLFCPAALGHSSSLPRNHFIGPFCSLAQSFLSSKHSHSHLIFTMYPIWGVHNECRMLGSRSPSAAPTLTSYWVGLMFFWFGPFFFCASTYFVCGLTFF